MPVVTGHGLAGAGDREVPFFRPRIHMVSRESMSVRPRPNHSPKDRDTGFSSSWPQANLRYPAQAWRKASITAFWRSFGGAGRKEGVTEAGTCGHKAGMLTTHETASGSQGSSGQQ